MTKIFNEPVEFEAEVRHKVIPHVFVDKLQPLSTTPRVSNVTAVIASATAPITVTDFTKGSDGQPLRILGDGFTTVAHNAKIKRIIGSTSLLEIDRVYEFIFLENIWYEVAGNTGGIGDIIVDFVIDGGGNVITAGFAGELRVPEGTITSISLITDSSTGTLVLDIWVDTYANIPLTVADTITAAAKPTMTNVRKYRDTTLTGWDTSVPADAFMGFNVDTITGYKRVTGAVLITGV